MQEGCSSLEEVHLCMCRCGGCMQNDHTILASQFKPEFLVSFCRHILEKFFVLLFTVLIVCLIDKVPFSCVDFLQFSTLK
jgi:hypothetical protein